MNEHKWGKVDSNMLSKTLWGKRISDGGNLIDVNRPGPSDLQTDLTHPPGSAFQNFEAGRAVYTDPAASICGTAGDIATNYATFLRATNVTI